MKCKCGWVAEEVPAPKSEPELDDEIPEESKLTESGPGLENEPEEEQPEEPATEPAEELTEETAEEEAGEPEEEPAGEPEEELTEEPEEETTEKVADENEANTDPALNNVLENRINQEIDRLFKIKKVLNNKGQPKTLQTKIGGVTYGRK